MDTSKDGNGPLVTPGTVVQEGLGGSTDTERVMMTQATSPVFQGGTASDAQTSGETGGAEGATGNPPEEATGNPPASDPGGSGDAEMPDYSGDNGGQAMEP